MVVKVEHIGVAVKSVDETAKLYCDILGIKPETVGREVVASAKIKVAMIPIGESKIELLEGLDPEGTIPKFIANRGEGIHHIAVGVKDIKKELERLK